MRRSELPNPLPPKEYEFFRNVEYYLEEENEVERVLFYGSITRSDYVPKKSDIDIAVFSDNEHSDMTKLQHLLRCKRRDFEKIVWKLNGTMIYGYKVKCEPINGINCEIAIYNNDFRDILMEEFTKPLKCQPFLITCLMYVLKMLYYHIPILTKKQYADCKRFVLNDLMGKESVFYVFGSEDS